LSPLTKYLLLQIPGWLLIGILLLWLWPETGLSPWIARAGYALWVAKDFALYPFLRSGYESGVPTGAESLVGAVAVTRGTLDPNGYVGIGGELWKAELVSGEAPIPPQTEVRVETVRGLTLFVVRVRSPSQRR